MLATVLISSIILIIFLVNLRQMVVNVKNGKSIDGCSGDCSKCTGCGHH